MLVSKERGFKIVTKCDASTKVYCIVQWRIAGDVNESSQRLQEGGFVIFFFQVPPNY